MKKERIAMALMLSLVFTGFANTSLKALEDKEKAKKNETKVSSKNEAGKSRKKVSESSRNSENHKTGANKIAAGQRTAGANDTSISSAAIGKKFLLYKPINEFTESDKKKIRFELEILRQRKTTQQFLLVIQKAEAGQPNIMVGDKRGCRVDNLKKHPGEVLPKRCFYYFYVKGKLFYSTASGNYQITRTNYRLLAPFLNIIDFEVPNQQLLAMEIVRRGGRKPQQVRKGFEALVKGNVRQALKIGTPDWASIPGSDLPGKKRKDFDKIVNGVLNDSKRQARPVTAKNSATNQQSKSKKVLSNTRRKQP